jgi:hypothetical protein
MLSLGGKFGVASGRTRVIDVSVPQAVGLAALVISSDADAEWEFYIDRQIADLARPGQPTLSTSAALGQLAASTKVYVRVTAVDANGLESPPSAGGKVVTVGSATNTNRVSASWSAVTGASSYNVYVGSRPGMEALYGSTASTSLNIDSLPGDTASAIPTASDIVISPLRGTPTPIQGSSGVPISIGQSLVVYVTCQTSTSLYVTCLAG